LLAGQVNHDRLHQECGNYHEIDLEGIFRPCTKLAATVSANDQIPALVEQAFVALTTGRRRPAVLFFPQDLMAAPATLTGHRVAPLHTCDKCGKAMALRQGPRGPFLACTGYPECRNAKAVDDRGNPLNPVSVVDVVPHLHEAVDLLARSQRPILLAGGGAVWAGAGPELHALAKKLDCPVITTLNGKGILDERDPLSLGHARSFKARALLPQADLLVAIGCRFTEVFTWFRTLQFPKNIIQIDLDPGQIGINYPVAVGMVADARTALREMLTALPGAAASDWRYVWPQAHAAQRVRPEWLIDTLRAELPEDGVVFADASEMGYRMHFDYPAYAPRTFFYPSNYIALGWGFPAALGAAVALPDRPIVSVSGDGGFLMTGQELATAVRYGVKLIAIVHNDAAYGAIRNIQRKKHEGRYLDTDLNNPDFMKLAAAYGLPGARAVNAEEFRKVLRAALARTGPSLIEMPDQWRSLRA
jgi:acetolactate synthase-1/2/3 large subunit